MDYNIKSIKLIVFDFDGVFTDNKVIVSDQGRESVICNRSDGIGLSRVKSLNIEMLILSTETNSVVTHRANKLKLKCVQGVENKFEHLLGLVSSYNVSLEEVAFVGNDINDLECLRVVGLPVVVADAYPEVKKVAKLILNNNGGDGAVREFCDIVFRETGECIEK